MAVLLTVFPSQKEAKTPVYPAPSMVPGCHSDSVLHSG
jgi:hypothetical protein